MSPKLRPAVPLAAITFTQGLVYTGEVVFIAGSVDALDPRAAFTRVFQWVDGSPARWWKHDLEWRVTAVAYFGPLDEELDDAVFLSEEGHVHYVGPSHAQALNEKIPGAGVNSPDALGLGYMTGLRQIGAHLYACGGGGQVYRRSGPRAWDPVDTGLRQAPGVDGQLLPRAIDGASEEDIYLVGSIAASGHPPFVCHWNGAGWQSVPLPPMAGRITNLWIESVESVWLCGANGTLLCGNARDGFVDLSVGDDSLLFYGLCPLEGRLMLSSNLGLFSIDRTLQGARVRKMETGLDPEPRDANILSVADGVLWSIGAKDIVRFDGDTWTRVQHPDNDPN